MTPFISIITPTYNRKDLLEKAILSVKNQDRTLPFEYEHIIIDDGSTDGTKEFIQKYSNDQEYHIIYRYQENGGVGKARNHALSLINKESTYTLFLDSDDEIKADLIRNCLEKWSSLDKNKEYESILGFYFLCEDEAGNILGDKKILLGQSERRLTYSDYLAGAINIEMGIITKSSLFLNDPKLRFEEDIITEGVMWAKMWKFMAQKNLEIIILEHPGRIYKVEHSSETRITKTFSIERFRKNAIGNERVLALIEADLNSPKFREFHAETVMRTGLNWILAGEKKKGIHYLKESLAIHSTWKSYILLYCTYISPRIIYTLYTLYV